MSDTSTTTLQKMLAPPRAAQEDVPLTSSRAVRLAMTRSADDSHGLILSVDTVTETLIELDELSSVITDQLLLIGLQKDDNFNGIIALDSELRSAIIEMQTIGNILPTEAEEREPTATDTMLVLPMLANFLQKLEETTPRTELDNWSNDAKLGQRIETLRSASLALPDKGYRAIQITAKFEGSERTGSLSLILPAHHAAPLHSEETKQPADLWAQNLYDTVQDSQAVLDATIYQGAHPLAQIQSWSVGDVVPLFGCTVSSIQMIDTKGKISSTAKLGQYAGLRAVRLQPYTPHMHEFSQAKTQTAP